MATLGTKRWLWNHLKRPLIDTTRVNGYGAVYNLLNDRTSFFEDATLLLSYTYYDYQDTEFVQLYKFEDMSSPCSYGVLTVYQGSCEGCLTGRDETLLNEEERQCGADIEEIAGVLGSLKRAIERVYVTDNEQDARAEFDRASTQLNNAQK